MPQQNPFYGLFLLILLLYVVIVICLFFFAKYMQERQQFVKQVILKYTRLTKIRTMTMEVYNDGTFITYNHMDMRVSKAYKLSNDVYQKVTSVINNSNNYIGQNLSLRGFTYRYLTINNHKIDIACGWENRAPEELLKMIIELDKLL